MFVVLVLVLVLCAVERVGGSADRGHGGEGAWNDAIGLGVSDLERLGLKEELEIVDDVLKPVQICRAALASGLNEAQSTVLVDGILAFNYPVGVELVAAELVAVQTVRDLVA